MISEKKILQTDFEGKNSCKEIPGEKKSYAEKKSVMAYNARKNLTPLYFRKKLYQQRSKRSKNYNTNQITHTPPPPPLQKSNGRPLNEPLTLRQSTICKIDASIYDAELMALMYDYVTRARISPPSFVRKHNSSHLHSLCVGILAFHLYCLWNSFMQNFATLYFQNEAWR